MVGRAGQIRIYCFGLLTLTFVPSEPRITNFFSSSSAVTDSQLLEIKFPSASVTYVPQVLTESGIELENGSTTGERFKVACAETDSTVPKCFRCGL